MLRAVFSNGKDEGNGHYRLQLPRLGDGRILRTGGDDWEAENRRLHESELLEIAKKSAREFIHNADGEPYAQEDWEMYLTEDASRVNKDTEAAMNYAIDDGDWFTLAEYIDSLANA